MILLSHEVKQALIDVAASQRALDKAGMLLAKENYIDAQADLLANVKVLVALLPPEVMEHLPPER